MSQTSGAKATNSRAQHQEDVGECHHDSLLAREEHRAA